MTPLQFEEACNILGNLLPMMVHRHGRPWEFSKAAPDLQLGDPLYKLVAASAFPGPLPIYEGGCENTIYGAELRGVRRNGMYRAWHDSVHLDYKLSFTFEDETQVAAVQAGQARKAMEDLGYAPTYIANVQKVLMGEVVGQLQYFKKHGCFPADQVACVRNYCGVS